MDPRIVVLLVQPHDDGRDMYAEFLTHNGFETIAVSDAQSALNHAPRAAIIVTGIRIDGDIDGVELVARLRRDHATRQKPIIVLTACALEADEKRAHDAGCDVFLPKPCLPDHLFLEIQRLLKRRSPRTRAKTEFWKDANQSTRNAKHHA